MDLSIVIVSFNTKDLLKKCLKSVVRSLILAVSAEVIVVDNGSTDNSPDMVKKEFSNIKLIENRENLGFAKAVNQGIKKTQGDFILLLNSDIIAKPGAIWKLSEFTRNHPETGVVGGRFFDADGSSQGSCFFLPTLRRAIREFWLGDKGFSVVKKYVPEGEGPSEVEAVMGAVFLISRKVIDQVGLFDERYFMYFEDLDYCRRVRKAGFKVYYLPTAEFIHYHGVSGKMIPEKTHQWLVESSKIYHGKFKYYLLTFIIWTGQKWQRFLKKI